MEQGLKNEHDHIEQPFGEGIDQALAALPTDIIPDSVSVFGSHSGISHRGIVEENKAVEEAKKRSKQQQKKNKFKADQPSKLLMQESNQPVRTIGAGQKHPEFDKGKLRQRPSVDMTIPKLDEKPNTLPERPQEEKPKREISILDMGDTPEKAPPEE